MLVYRVEDSDGRGPYNSYMAHVPGLLMAHNQEGPKTRPNTYADPKLRHIMQDHEFCGFTSLTDMGQWFEGFGEALEDNDFTITEYEIDPSLVLHGSGQVVFEKYQAKKVRVHAPTKYIDRKQA